MAKSSVLWNRIAPLISGVLILAICFVWIAIKKRQADAVKMTAQNAQTLQLNLQKKQEAERLKKEHSEKLAAMRAQELANRLVNVLRQKSTAVKQSGVYRGCNGSFAADGNIGGSVEEENVAVATPVLDRKRKAKMPAWWMCEMEDDRDVSKLIIYNVVEEKSKQRLSNFKVTLVNSEGEVVFEKSFFTKKGQFSPHKLEVELPMGTKAKVLHIGLLGANALGDGALNLAEVELYGPSSTLNSSSKVQDKDDADTDEEEDEEETVDESSTEADDEDDADED